MAFAVAERPATQKSKEQEGRIVRIALVQASSAVGNETFDPRDDNLAKALDSIDKAADDGANFAVFGEMYLSGYRTDEWLHKWATTVTPPDDHVKALVEKSRRRNIVILMGMGTFGAIMPGDVYNSTLILNPDGRVDVYRKCHVAGFPYSDGVSLERCFYSPGRELPVYETALGRIGVHICYDMSFPEVPRVQALKGAEMLFNTSGSAAGFEGYWDHIAFARAVENLSWYIVCSVVGKQRDTMLFGGSRIISPSGVEVAHAKHNVEDYVVADIDLDEMKGLRASTHTLSTRQPELYSPIADPVRHP